MNLFLILTSSGVLKKLSISMLRKQPDSQIFSFLLATAPDSIRSPLENSNWLFATLAKQLINATLAQSCQYPLQNYRKGKTNLPRNLSLRLFTGKNTPSPLPVTWGKNMMMGREIGGNVKEKQERGKTKGKRKVNE